MKDFNKKDNFLEYEEEDKSSSESKEGEIDFSDLKDIDFQTNLITSKLCKNKEENGNGNDVDFLNL